MATPPSGTGFALTLERDFKAPPERVFEAFTTAEQLARWFGPTDDHTCTVHECDVRAGGRYKIEMKHKGGNVHIVLGTYERVTRPSQLVFTFGWETNPAFGVSRVTVNFEARDSGTKLILVQEHFTSAEIRDGHDAGWNGSLARLARLF